MRDSWFSHKTLGDVCEEFKKEVKSQGINLRVNIKVVGEAIRGGDIP